MFVSSHLMTEMALTATRLIVGTVAWQAHLRVYELARQQASLEQAFMQITEDSVEYRSADATAGVAA